MQSLAPGQGPVAVHRWFARGEDWAMHPFFTAHTVEMLQALDELIKARQPGRFQVPAAGGVLIGELLDDLECLDPRAQERRPCLVRLAFVGGPLSEEEQSRVMAALQKLPLPVAPGVDPYLLISVPLVRPLPRQATSPASVVPARSGWPLFVLGAGVVVVLVFFLWWALRGPVAEQPSAPRQSEPRAHVPAPSGLLERYGRVDHPYIAFLHAHPEALARPRRADERTYESWRTQQGMFRDDGHPLPRALRERVAAWRDLDGSLSSAAVEMRRLRRKWGGEELPFLADEFDAFFATLVRPDGLRPREEFDHPANDFLWRLPDAPIAAGRTFDTDAALRQALRELLYRLGDQLPLSKWTNSVHLLRSIETELDYTAWREKQRERLFVDDDQPPGPVIERALQPFLSRP